MAVTPPRPKGPPLNALRAFEAAARLGSFKAAAEELSVTPGAVAQHIKALEAWSEARLFVRHPQGVQLTALGLEALSGFVVAFDRLGEAVQLLRAKASPKHLRIAALPSIAQLWLSPRLPAIRAAGADKTISITAMEFPPNLKREPFDLSIFFEKPSKDPQALEIARDRIFPVCAPRVAAKLRTPFDLPDMVCLHDANWSGDWKRWIEAVCPGQIIDTHGPVFSLYSLAVEEAINGAGVLIGHEPLVGRYLRSGALVAPFETQIALEQTLTVRTAKQVKTIPALREIIEALRDPGAD